MSLDVWEWRSPLPQGNEIECVAFGNGTFVAVTRAGTVMRSTDTVNWTIKKLCPGLSAVRFLNNLFVAVGSYGRLFTSTDGAIWDEPASGTSHALADVSYGHGRFVAVGQCGAMTSSPDGKSWTPQSSGISGKENEDFRGISFGNNVFIITGLNQTVLRSSDGLLWKDESPSTPDRIGTIAFGGGHFVAVNDSGLLRSPDGLDWEPVVFPGSEYLQSVEYVNGGFVAVGMKEDTGGGDDFAAIFTSINGHDWTERTDVRPVTREWLFGTAFGNGTYLIGGFGGTILTSSDAITWYRNTSDSSATFYGIAYGNGTFVAVGRRRPIHGLPQDPVMAASSDLVTWTEIPCPLPHPLSAVVYTGNDTTEGSFIAVGVDAAVLISRDGLNWRPHIVPHSMNAITVHGGTIVGVGHGGTILRSTDTQYWSDHSKGTDALWSITYGAGCFAAAGANGTIMTSHDDGKTWCRRSTKISTELRGITFGNNRFVAVSYYGQMLSSTDGMRWDLQSDSPEDCWTGIYYSPQVPGFIALSNDRNCMATSPDGSVWTQRDTGMVNNALHACTFGNGSFFAVGGKSSILQSEAFRPLSVERPMATVQSPQKSGTQATWRCAATGRPRLSYAFTLTKLHVLRRPTLPHPRLTFQSKPEFTCTLPSAGTYVLTAHVRDGHGTVISRDSLPFVVT